MSYCWYAVYTNPRAEKKINERLLKKNIEAYLPLQKKLSQWKDRKRWIEEPLIRSYIFVKVSEKEYYDVLNTLGIVRYVTFSGKAAPIPEWQILAMKQLLESGQDYEITTESFQKGDYVEVVSGALTGMQGELISFKGERKVLIRIDHINHCLIVNVPLLQLKPVK
jgi:transcriptional antiterminator RfaH